MLATSTLTADQYTGLRCSACRYFTLDRCCNASARLEGTADHQGDCRFFRFALTTSPQPVWELR